MGTRSLTRFYQDNRVIMVMYRQFDGFPDAHGADLKSIIESYSLVNGIPCGMDEAKERKLANGMSELCALVVRDLKIDNPSGNIYLYPHDSSDVGEEFEYEVHGGFDREPIMFKVKDSYSGKVIYDGLLSDFDPKMKY